MDLTGEEIGFISAVIIMFSGAFILACLV